MLNDVQIYTDYRPSVCQQTGDTTHIHYNIILATAPPINSSNLDLLRNIANRIGGRTAGQVIERIQTLDAAGANLYAYGIVRLEREPLPTYQKCVKNDYTQPIDWDTVLSGPQIVEPPPARLTPTLVRKIIH